MSRHYCGLTGCGVERVGDRCDECGAPWSAHREIDAAWCGGFVRCGRGDRDHGHLCDREPGHAGPHHTAGCDGGAT